MLYTVLLGTLCVVILQLQLQPANGSPQMFYDDLVRLQDQVVPLSANDLIQRLKVFVKVQLAIYTVHSRCTYYIYKFKVTLWLC